ncbi:error-prone DNA polymerase [Homoserinibacter sp. YIM 151385]|uniref:error-prone DNA polymerase n=1 Tax=Homoserinibacter sp. YIM 151385 TaxID=2985506 RepID=UPI0022F0D216|nr:error-prone DNA polymerase [Homoserinibacter sp. YIM 151385]WBU38563.1 error-prone DNA polymerase [Homoserinibacter sp. YIM 151385]
MGWSNPPVSWSEFERALSDRRRPNDRPPDVDGGDSPAWSLKRPRYRQPEDIVRDETAPPYAELHAHSSYSFLDGASSPEELVEEAERLGLHALALVDHDGFYGLVRFAEAAEPAALHTVFGAELSLGLSGPQNGEPDPEGAHLLVLARGEEGYHRLSGAITAAQLAGGEKGRPVYDLDELAERARDDTGTSTWRILTGCRKGAVRQALRSGGAAAAGAALDRLTARFGRDSVVVELHDHGLPLDSEHNDALAALAAERGLPVVATGNVHYASPDRRRLADALAAVRAQRSLDELEGWLPAAGAAHLRSGHEMQARFARYPGAVARTVELADELAFPLRRAKPALPRQRVPEGHTPMSWLRQLVWEAVPERYPELREEDRARIERELAVIEQKDFPGYFLIVHGIVDYARGRGILCQGRGSAANSAVCYLLGITAIDAIFYRLPFERFLSSLRDEEPDIDVDFDSDRREEVIQHVYETYGRENAAQVANVIQYRPKNAIRDTAKALGHPPGQQDAWSKQVERWGASLTSAGDHDIPAPVTELAQEMLGLPRHLGIHSGGMVLTDRPVGEVVPIEHARMERRTVIQWDKDDAAWMGLVKFDLLGLGMLAALQHCFDLVEEHTGEHWTLQSMPKEEPAVYDMLCRADSIGVFQVESRAQMGLLPRLQPRRFYDLVVQIALVRPGPIQGGAVHPFVRRKLGQEPVTYLHPKLVEPLERTLGVPVFQEQLMQMAVAIGNCSGEDADQLRRAMGSKRGLEKIERLRETLYTGMAANGLTGEVADEIYQKIQAFANFGFAESHSLSFALLVYASSWLKLHYPAVFLAGLLRSQPMGFYSPSTLTADARRHGVVVRRPDLLRSGAEAGLEPLDLAAPPGARPPSGLTACVEPRQPEDPGYDPDAPVRDAEHRRDGEHAVRLGLAGVRTIGAALAERLVAERTERGPWQSMEDLVRRTGLTTPQLEALAAAGAFDGMGLGRREAMWRAGSAALDRVEFLAGSVTSIQPPLFPDPSAYETLAADLWTTGISTEDHPMAHFRAGLDERGVLAHGVLRDTESGRRIEVAGVVTHRQRPATASGITFLNLEDETGLTNVIISVGVWGRYRRVVRDSPALIVRGILERSSEGVVNLVADRVEALGVGVSHRSRDFQ